MTSGDFPDDEEPTKRQTVQFRASRLVADWQSCSPRWQRMLELLASSEEMRAGIDDFVREILKR